MEELNIHQMQILNTLMFLQKGKFSQLNTEKMENDHFKYHIKALCDSNHILKNEDNTYSLTIQGKKYVSHMDLFNAKLEKQPKTCVTALCIKIDNGIEKFLVHKKKKHPCYDFCGLPGGKVKEGNFLVNEVLRELEEETGITGTPELIEVKHMISILKSTKEIQSDGIYYCFKITDIKGELKNTIEGENYWMTIEEFLLQEKIFVDVIETIDVYHSGNLSFLERIDEYESI